jgi:hypothetical protein
MYFLQIKAQMGNLPDTLMTALKSQMVHLELQHHVLQASASVEHPYGMEQLQAK